MSTSFVESMYQLGLVVETLKQYPDLQRSVASGSMPERRLDEGALLLRRAEDVFIECS